MVLGTSYMNQPHRNLQHPHCVPDKTRQQLQPTATQATKQMIKLPLRFCFVHYLKTTKYSFERYGNWHAGTQDKKNNTFIYHLPTTNGIKSVYNITSKLDK